MNEQQPIVALAGSVLAQDQQPPQPQAQPAASQPQAQPAQPAPTLFVSDMDIGAELKQFLEREATVVCWSARVFANRTIAFFARMPSTVLYVNIARPEQRHWLEMQQLDGWRVVTLARRSSQSDWVSAFETPEGKLLSVTKRAIKRMIEAAADIESLISSIANSRDIDYVSCFEQIARKALQRL